MADDLGMSSGALSECLSDPKQWSKWVEPIDAYFRKKGWPDADPSRWATAAPTDEPAPVDRDDPKAATIRRNVRLLRTRAGFDLEGAASEAGVSYDQWERWEQGRDPISFSHLELIAKTLGHDAMHFWADWNGSEPPATALAPHERLWARRNALPPELREQIRREQDELAKERYAVLSPGFASAKKAVQAKMGKAKGVKK